MAAANSSLSGCLIIFLLVACGFFAGKACSGNTSSNNNQYYDRSAPQINRISQPETPEPEKNVEEAQPYRSAGPTRYRQYIRGPRGGCYYISSSGNKVYVDRSLCN